MNYRTGTRHRLAVGLFMASLLAIQACSGGASPSASTPAGTPTTGPASPTPEPSMSEVDALYEEAKKEGQLVLYSSFIIEQIENITNGFKEAYPGIEVEYLRGDNLEEQIASEVAANQPTADTFNSTARRTHAAFDDGWTVAYVPPESLTLPEIFQDPDGRYVNIGQNITTFAYNTDCVAESDVPKTWDEVVDPKWKGKTALQDPLQGGGVTSWLRTFYYEWGEDRFDTYMEKLVANEPIYGNYTATQETIASGEACIMPSAYPTFVEPLKKDGAPIEWGVPEFGITTTNTMALTKTARHPNAAKLFMNWIISEEGQRVFTAGGGYAVRPGTNTADYARLEGVDLINSPFLKFAEDQDFWDKRIPEIFGQ